MKSGVHLPRVLPEEVVRLTAPLRIGLRSNLGVIVGKSVGEVRHGDTRGCTVTGPVVAKGEVTVLIVRTARNGIDVDLIVIVLARVHQLEATLDRVISQDFRDAVGVRIYRAARVRGVRSASEAVEIPKPADRRDLVLGGLVARNDVGEINPERLAVEAR